jgi:hypothetical protein
MALKTQSSLPVGHDFPVYPHYPIRELLASELPVEMLLDEVPKLQVTTLFLHGQGLFLTRDVRQFGAFKDRKSGLVFGGQGIDLLFGRCGCRAKARVGGFALGETGVGDVDGLLDELGFCEGIGIGTAECLSVSYSSY